MCNIPLYGEPHGTKPGNAPWVRRDPLLRTEALMTESLRAGDGGEGNAQERPGGNRRKKQMEKGFRSSTPLGALFRLFAIFLGYSLTSAPSTSGRIRRV